MQDIHTKVIKALYPLLSNERYAYKFIKEACEPNITLERIANRFRKASEVFMSEAQMLKERDSVVYFNRILFVEKLANACEKAHYTIIFLTTKNEEQALLTFEEMNELVSQVNTYKSVFNF